jgi:hypothetical protein
MNAPTSKNTTRRGLRLLDWLMQDWVWEVFLILIVAPVVVDKFLSLGSQSIA